MLREHMDTESVTQIQEQNKDLEKDKSAKIKITILIKL